MFSILYLWNNFLKNENLFQKTGVSLLVEISKTENVIFPFRTALSEANDKTNRMGCTKWTYSKEYFICLKTLFQFNNL